MAFAELIESRRLALEKAFERERMALERKYDGLYEPLDARLRSVVQGKEEAPELSPEEAESLREDEDAPLPAPVAPKKAEEATETEEAKEGEEAEAKETVDASSGIPSFWLTALQGHPDVCEEITEKDAQVLAYLTDISSERIVGLEDSGSFALTFAFAPNPFFTNKTLRKCYYLEDSEDLVLERITSDTINWKPGQDVTKKVLRKKLRPGQRGHPATKVTSIDSFFNFFSRAQLPEEGAELTEQEMDELQESMENDYELAEIINEDVVAHPVGFFTGTAIQPDDEDEDEDDEDEDEDDEDSEEDSEDEDSEEDSEEDSDADSDADSEEDDDDEDDKPKKRQPQGAKRGKGKAVDAQAQPQECKQQ